MQMVHENRSARKKNMSDIRQYNTRDLETSVSPVESDTETITVAGQVLLKAICETTLLISTRASGLLKAIFNESVARAHAYITATRVMDVHFWSTFHVPIAFHGGVNFNLVKHRKAHEVIYAPDKIVRIKGQCYLYHSGAHKNTSKSFVNAVH